MQITVQLPSRNLGSITRNSETRRSNRRSKCFWTVAHTKRLKKQRDYLIPVSTEYQHRQKNKPTQNRRCTTERSGKIHPEKHGKSTKKQGRQHIISSVIAVFEGHKIHLPPYPMPLGEMCVAFSEKICNFLDFGWYFAIIKLR